MGMLLLPLALLAAAQVTGAPGGEACGKACGEACGWGWGKDVSGCEHCLAQHGNETKKGNCSEAKLKAFCALHPAPPQPHGDTGCQKELGKLCGDHKHNRTACDHCRRAQE